MRRMLAVLALTFVACMVVAACSGDTKSTDDGPPSTTQPTITQAPASEATTTEAPDPAEETADPSLAGTQYGYITGVDESARTLTFDKVEWFTGAAATQACEADGVIVRDNEKCNDYYIRNNNELLRTAPISPAAKFSLQSPDDALVQLETTLPELSAKRKDRLFIISFTNGSVTRVKEQFLP